MSDPRDDGGKVGVGGGRRSRLATGAGCLGVLLLLPVLAWALWIRPVEVRREQLLPRFEAALAHADGRVERPVLRGDSVDGNAADTQREAVARIVVDPELFGDGAMARIAAGDIWPELRETVERERAHLAAYRAAAQRTHTWTRVDLARGPEAPIPDFVPSMKAAKLLLAQGRIDGPDACVQAATDVIRLGQDLAPGALLIGQMIQAALVQMAGDVLAACLPEAGVEIRAEAADNLRVLAASAPPMGAALLEETAGMAFLGEILTRDLPLLPPQDDLDRWLYRKDAIEAAEILLDELPLWEAVDAVPYPEREARARAILDDRLTHENGLLDLAMPGYDAYLARDMASNAQLRMLALGAADLAREVERTGPPPGMDDPALVDPFSGHPLRFRRGEAGELTLWAVGVDGNDDGGRQDPGERVPGPDVALALAAPAAPPPTEPADAAEPSEPTAGEPSAE